MQAAASSHSTILPCRPDGAAGGAGGQAERPNAGIAAATVVSASVVEQHVASISAMLRLPPSEADNRRVLAVLRYLGCRAKSRADEQEMT